MCKNVIAFISAICNQQYRFLDFGLSHHVYKSPCFIRITSGLDNNICINTIFQIIQGIQMKLIVPFFITFRVLCRLWVAASFGLWAMARSEPSQAINRYPRYVSREAKESLKEWNKKSIESVNNFWRCWEKAATEAISGENSSIPSILVGRYFHSWTRENRSYPKKKSYAFWKNLSLDVLQTTELQTAYL